MQRVFTRIRERLLAGLMVRSGLDLPARQQVDTLTSAVQQLASGDLSARVSLAARLMPLQVQIGLDRVREWTRAHHANQVQ